VSRKYVESAAGSDAKSSGGVLLVVVVWVLRRRLADGFEHPRVARNVGGGDLAQRQANTPLVPEIEDVRDSLTLGQPQAVEPALGALALGLGDRQVPPGEGVALERKRMGVLAAITRPELPAQPERIKMVVVPIKRRSQRIVKVYQRLVTAYSDRPANTFPPFQLGAEDVHVLRHDAPLDRDFLTLRALHDGNAVALDAHAALACQCVAVAWVIVQDERGRGIGEITTAGDPRDTKAVRRVARELVGSYYEAQPAELIDHIRDALGRYGAGEIDAFDLDDVIHQYKRAARELWKFCVGGGSHVLFAARMLEYLEAEGELPDWWEAGALPRRR
jgi:hypothetical protein